MIAVENEKGMTGRAEDVNIVHQLICIKRRLWEKRKIYSTTVFLQ